MKYSGLLFSSLIACTSPAFATVYSQTDQNGNVIYSDAPFSKQAQPVPSLPSNVISPLTVPSSAPKENSSPVQVKNSYSAFGIASPQDGDTIQNQPNIDVGMTVNPDLQPGDKIQVFLDGNPWGDPQASTHFSFTAPDRGTHQLSAKLFDQQGQVLREAGPITVYIHQAHIGGAT